MASHFTSVYSLDQVVELLKIKREDVYFAISKGLAPPPMIYSDSHCYWSRKELDYFLEIKQQGASPVELKMFCDELLYYRESVINELSR